MDKKVLRRVKKYKKDFDIYTQKAELLRRNPQFLHELKTMMDWTIFNGVKDKEFQKEMKETRHYWTGRHYLNIRKEIYGRLRKRIISEKIIDANHVEDVDPKNTLNDIFHNVLSKGLGKSEKQLIAFINVHNVRWKEFCMKWNIQPEWDGNLNTIKDYLRSLVKLYWVKGKESRNPAILIEIDNWTRKQDITEIWDKIEKYQAKMGRKQEIKPNFTRDLSWYDLYRNNGLKPREIAEIWINKYPDEIDLLVVRRMKKRIDRSDLRGKYLEDCDFLIEIKAGFLKEKYLSEFEEEKCFYTTGQDTRGKFNPPFIDVIKKAIKRMEEEINQIEALSSAYSLDIGEVLSSGMAIRQG